MSICEVGRSKCRQSNFYSSLDDQWKLSCLTNGRFGLFSLLARYYHKTVQQLIVMCVAETDQNKTNVHKQSWRFYHNDVGLS